MRVETPALRASVKMMRVLCPLGLVAAVVIGSYAWMAGNNTSLAIDAYCAGVSSVLTWIQYRFFQL